MPPLPRWLLVGLCPILTTCGGDSGAPQAPVATVAISPNPIQVQVGSTVQLTATLQDANGNGLTGRTVAWSSTTPANATVDANGLVHGVAAGPASIQAASEGKSATAAVTVSTAIPVPVAASLLVAVTDKNGDRITSDLTYSDAVTWLTIELIVPPPPSTKINYTFNTTGFLRSPAPRAAAGSTPALTGTVLFAGGYADQTAFNATRDAVILDPATYATTAIQMHDPRSYHTLTLLPGSRILAAGGFDGDAVSNTAEIWSESSGQFATTGSMHSARGRHAAAPLADGRVLVTGGLVPVGAGPVTIDVATTEIFDPASGTFTDGPDMGVARFNHSAVTLDDGRVLVLGGNRLKSAEVYDPVANDFTPVGDMAVVHGLGHQAVKLLDGRVLVVGGDSAVVRPTAVAEIFDPATNQFTRVADMAVGRMLHFAVLADDGKVIVGGGQDDQGDLLASVEVYDPVGDAFAPGPDLPGTGPEPVGVFIPR